MSVQDLFHACAADTDGALAVPTLSERGIIVSQHRQ